MALPTYRQLPEGPAGGRLGWNLFGDDDSVGMLNLVTPEVVAAAARLVRTGQVFPLDVPFGFFTPPLTSARGNPRRTAFTTHLPAVTGLDEVYDNYYPQIASQWDALSHASYSANQFYNGASIDDVARGKNTIEHWARRAIVGRAVVLDLEHGRASYDPGSATAFGVDDLERARVAAGVDYAPGDIVLLHTGFTRWYSEQSAEVKEAIPQDLKAPGIEHSEEVCEYFWDHRVSALASDTIAVEVWPADFSADAAPFGFIHQMLIGSFGMALGELWWLADLVRACHADGVFEAMLVSSPLHAEGGAGSPANAVAIR